MVVVVFVSDGTAGVGDEVGKRGEWLVRGGSRGIVDGEKWFRYTKKTQIVTKTTYI